jgi:pyrimidine-specific ribonucleoside hydrolase
VTLYREMFRERYGVDAAALHDTLAVLEAITPGTLRPKPFPVSVACTLGPARGMTEADRRPDAPGPLVQVALDADVPAVLSETLRRLITLG